MRTITIQLSALLCMLMMMASCSSDNLAPIWIPPNVPCVPLAEDSDLTDMRSLYADRTEWSENIVLQCDEIPANCKPNVSSIDYKLKQELDDRGGKRLRIYRDSHKTSMLLYVDEKEITGEIESTHERRKLYDFSSGLVHGEKFSFSLFELKDGEAIGFKDFDVTLQDVEITSRSKPHYPWYHADGCFRLKGFSTLEGAEIYSFGGQFIGKGGLFCYDSDVNWTENEVLIPGVIFYDSEGAYHFIYDEFGEQSY